MWWWFEGFVSRFTKRWRWKLCQLFLGLFVAKAPVVEPAQYNVFCFWDQEISFSGVYWKSGCR